MAVPEQQRRQRWRDGRACWSEATGAVDGAVAEPGMGGAPPASGRDDRQGEAEKRAGDARARWTRPRVNNAGGRRARRGRAASRRRQAHPRAPSTLATRASTDAGHGGGGEEGRARARGGEEGRGGGGAGAGEDWARSAGLARCGEDWNESDPRRGVERLGKATPAWWVPR